MSKRKNFQWRYQPSRESTSGILLVYIDDLELHPNKDKTKMMMAALKAFYLVEAYLARGKSQAEVERIGWDSVFALLRQVDYLCSALGLDRTQVGGLVPLGFNGGDRIAPKNAQVKQPSLESKQVGDSSYNLGGLSGCRLVYSDDDKD